MEIRYLQYFIALAEQLNFSETARSLFIEQSTLSKIIAKLEAHYHAVLFSRKKYGVELTEAGKTLLTDAREIVDRYEASLRHLSCGVSGTLTVYYCVGLEHWLIPPAIREISQRYPSAEIELHRCSWDDLDSLCMSAPSGIFIVFDFAFRKNSKLRAKTLMEDDMMLVVSPDHPLAGRSSIKSSELKGERFAFDQCKSGNTALGTMMDLLPKGASKTDIKQCCNSETVATLIRSGLAVTIRNRHDRLANPDLCYILLEDIPPAKLKAFTFAEKMTPEELCFLDCLKEAQDDLDAENENIK